MKQILFLGMSAFRGTILVSLFFLTGCTSMYLDGSLEEVDASQYKKPDPLRPVQTIFEFQSDGVSNQKATDYLKEKVMAQIAGSGLFSKVSDMPVENGGLLSITLNNVPITSHDDAVAKGFVAGFTFGLAGAQVTDGYICTARYSGSDTSLAIEKLSRHAIHTTVGNASAPENAVKAESADDAVTKMTWQVISNVLFSLSNDPEFR